MMPIFVGLWSKDTKAGVERGAIRELRQVVRRFSRMMWAFHRDRGIPATQQLLGIFAAPEYYMGRPQANDDPRGFDAYLTRDEKDRWTRELADLSEAHPSILLIPGTVLWRKPSAEKIAAYEDRETSHYDRFGRPLPPRFKNRTGKTRAAIQEQLSWREAAVTSGLQNRLTSTVVDAEDLAAKLRLFKARPQNVLRHILRNTAYVFFDGRLIFKYHKLSDYSDVGFHRVMTPDGTVFIPGRFWGRFEVDGIDFALEICYDHTQGMTALQNGPAPDFQILTSAAIQARDGRICVREGGFFLHVSSNWRYTEVKHRDGGLTRIDPMHSFRDVCGARLDMFAVYYSPVARLRAPLALPEW
jgi:predicted amidohydrolase